MHTCVCAPERLGFAPGRSGSILAVVSGFCRLLREEYFRARAGFLKVFRRVLNKCYPLTRREHNRIRILKDPLFFLFFLVFAYKALSL